MPQTVAYDVFDREFDFDSQAWVCPRCGNRKQLDAVGYGRSARSEDTGFPLETDPDPLSLTQTLSLSLMSPVPRCQLLTFSWHEASENIRSQSVPRVKPRMYGVVLGEVSGKGDAVEERAAGSQGRGLARIDLQ